MLKHQNEKKWSELIITQVQASILCSQIVCPWDSTRTGLLSL